MTTVSKSSRWENASCKKRLWSKNAVAAKSRLRMDRVLSPQAEIQLPVIPKTKPAKFSVKIKLERTDGGRIQFTCHRIGGKIYHNGNLVAPKSYFRRIGEIAELWSRE